MLLLVEQGEPLDEGMERRLGVGDAYGNVEVESAGDISLSLYFPGFPHCAVAKIGLFIHDNNKLVLSPTSTWIYTYQQMHCNFQI